MLCRDPEAHHFQFAHIYCLRTQLSSKITGAELQSASQRIHGCFLSLATSPIKVRIFNKNQNTMHLCHGQVALLFVLEAGTPSGFFLAEGLFYFFAPLDHLIFVIVLYYFHYK